MFDRARGDAQRFGHVGDFPGAAVRSGIAQQQRARMDKLGSRGLAAVRQPFQLAAFIFGEGNFITGFHAPSFTKKQPASICEI